MCGARGVPLSVAVIPVFLHNLQHLLGLFRQGVNRGDSRFNLGGVSRIPLNRSALVLFVAQNCAFPLKVGAESPKMSTQ